VGHAQQAVAGLAVQKGKLEAVEGASIGKEVFVRHRATEVVLGANPPHDFKGMEPIQIGAVHFLVAKGSILLNQSSNLMLLTIHSGIKEAEPDEKGSTALDPNQFQENPTLTLSEFGSD
jgi:hypothetical protein